MYLTRQNVDKYMGKTLDTNEPAARRFHCYPLKVSRWPDGEPCVRDSMETYMPVADERDKFNLFYFDIVDGVEVRE